MRLFPPAISKASYLIGGVFVIASVVAIFHPSWGELAVVMIVDAFAAAIAETIDRRLFIRLNPDFELLVPAIREDKIAALDKEGKKKLFLSMLDLPARRTRYAFIGSWFKIAPAGFTILFYWEQTLAMWQVLLLFILMEAVTHAYLYGCILIENHRFVSGLISEFHSKFNWTEVFREVEFPLKEKRFLIQESITFGSIAVFVISLQWILLLHGRWDLTGLSQTGLIPVIAVLGTLLFFRLWFLERRFFMDGLEHLFRTFETLDYGKAQAMIPLSSSPLLARFEATFNLLTDRLRSQEEYLSKWLIHETEQSRYRAIGEFSSLVVHDLMGPLQTIQFCGEELQKLPSLEPNRKYLDPLKHSSDRAMELIKALRGYLRSPRSRVVQTNYFEAHSYVLPILKAQFQVRDFSSVAFDVDTNLQDVFLRISQADLIHIVYNLYKNSIENFCEHEVAKPLISVRRCGTADGCIELRITDTGTGLSPDRFEKMTAFQFFPSNQQDFREGLGLRLIRRLVERNGGSLNVLPQATQGTTFQLRLQTAAAQST